MTQIQDEQAPKNCWYCGDEGLPEYEHHPCGVRMNCAVCGQRTPLEEGMDNALQNWNEQQEPTEFTLDKLQAAAKGMGYAVVPVEPSEYVLNGLLENGYKDHGGVKEKLIADYKVMISAAQGEGE